MKSGGVQEAGNGWISGLEGIYKSGLRDCLALFINIDFELSKGLQIDAFLLMCELIVQRRVVIRSNIKENV